MTQKGNHPRRQRSNARAYHLLEPLEQRQLMTVDLTGAFSSVPVSTSNASTRGVTLKLQNIGDTASHGNVLVDVYAVLVGTVFTKANAHFLGRYSRNGNIGAGANRVVTLNVSLTPALAGGSYCLYAVIDPTNRVQESNEGNNLAISAPIVVTQPAFDLIPAFGSVFNLPQTLTHGRTASAIAQVSVRNPSTSAASVPPGANSMVNIQIVARPVSAVGTSQDVILNTFVVNDFVGGLQPGGSRAVTVTLQIPGTLAIGTYKIVAQVDTLERIAETDETNNEVTLGVTLKIV